MPDLPAPFRQGVSSLQRRHSLINVGGCMGAFSQIFPLSKMLGGTNKFLATPDAPAQSLRTKSRCLAVEKRSAMKAERTQEAEIAIDLRKILDAKQEPFVLQEVIWEKRHPIRSKSSRELKFEVNEVVPPSRKLRSSKRAKSRDDKKNEDVSLNGDLSALSERSGEGSSALVKSNHMPAESMVALPSSQASPQRRKTRSSSSKMASTGKSPVKSPNKRALLMEAASKILEGSNRRASTSSSARSLLRELEGSKRAQELLKCKEAPLEEGPLGGGYTNTQRVPLQKVLTLRADSKQHPYCNVGTRFANQMQQVSPMDSPGMSDEEVLLIMQSRLFPSDGIPAAARGDSSELAMVADKSDAPQLANHVEGLNSDLSIVDGTQEETLLTLADVLMEGLEGSADGQTHQLVESIMVSTIIERHYMPLLDQGASVEKNEVEPETCGVSSNINLITKLPIQEIFDSLEGSTPQNHHHAEELHDFSISGEMPDEDYVDSGVDAAMSRSCETVIEEINAYTFPGPNANELVELCRSTGDKSCISVEEIRGDEVETAENAPTPLLQLCNYSWWTEEEMQAYPSTPSKNEISNNFTGYGSTIAATRGPFAIKVSEEWKEGENLLEDDSTSPDHSYVEEFQQSSPVSVLDTVYDDGPVLSKPFDYFDEARQKLMESLRRYEMLAHMDLDMLIKINEESLCHEFEEESGASSFEESWESDLADLRATQHQVPFMGSPDSESSRYGGGLPDVDAEDLAYDSLYEAAEDDFYTHSNEVLYMQQLQALADKHVVSTSDLIKDVRARFKAESDSRRCKALLDCASDPSDLHASREPHRELRSNSSTSTLEAVEKLTGSDIINAMLDMDLTTSSWSSFHEEVGVMEMEIESSLLAALMQEFLSDLLY